MRAARTSPRAATQRHPLRHDSKNVANTTSTERRGTQSAGSASLRTNIPALVAVWPGAALAAAVGMGSIAETSRPLPEDGERLLRRVATRLWEQAQEFVPKIFDGTAGHIPEPLVHFIQAQGAADAASFQLPEPLLGPVPGATEILVVGLNPGYGPTEEIPCVGNTLEEYVQWYAERMNRRDEQGRPYSNFEGKPGVIRHYVAVERDYLTPVLEEKALGRVAVYADAIPWKWNADNNPDLSQTDIGEFARARIAEIACVLQPSLVMTLGVRAAGFFGLWPSPDPIPQKADIGDWSGNCLPCFHPNKHWKSGEKMPHLERTHSAMRILLGR